MYTLPQQQKIQETVLKEKIEDFLMLLLNIKELWIFPLEKVTGWKGYIMQTLLIKDGAAVLILYTIDFKTRNITRKKTDIS